MREGDTAREAATLSQLGTLYYLMDRREEAVTFQRQATDRCIELGDLAGEGRNLSNLANTLVTLGRLDEAGKALDRAIVCNQSVGLTAEPWKTWAIFRNLEHAAGEPAAALAAYERAVESYLEYRQAGGENQNPGGRLCASVAQAVEEGNTEEIEALLGQPLDDEAADWARVLFPKLSAIVAGERDSGLARDMALNYDDAVELRLLLKRLSGPKDS